MSTEVKRIDPRGPRFGAGITAILSIISFYLAISAEFYAAYSVMAVMFALFSWSVFLPSAGHPYSVTFRKLIAPRLAPARELEDPRPPQFAQKVGLSFSVVGMLALPLGASAEILAIAAGFIFVASFLNAVFGLCLGCQMYLLLKRIRAIR